MCNLQEASAERWRGAIAWNIGRRKGLSIPLPVLVAAHACRKWEASLVRVKKRTGTKTSEGGKIPEGGTKVRERGNSDCQHRNSNPHILHLAMQMVWCGTLLLTPFLCPLAYLSPKDLTFELVDTLVQLRTISYMTAFLSVFWQSGSLLSGPNNWTGYVRKKPERTDWNSIG